MTAYALVAMTSTTALMGALAASFWWKRRDEPVHGWFALWMATNVVFGCGRLAQMLAPSPDYASLWARVVLFAAFVSAWVTARFATSYTGRSPNRLEQAVSVLLLGLPLTLLCFSDAIVTRTPIVRTLSFGQSFVGVELGPLYFLYPVSAYYHMFLGISRLVSAHALSERGSRMIFFAYLLGATGASVDMAAVIFKLSLPRFSDFTGVPIGFAFAWAQGDRSARLVGSLEERVRERTLALERANAQREAEHHEREALLQRLAESQRFESLGRLASGVAHDFNNLLAVIVGSTELVMRDHAAEPKATAAKRSLDAACEHGRALIGQLLAFARQQPVAPRALDVGEHLAQLHPLLHLLAGSGITLELRQEPCPEVRIDPTQLEQIVVNLLVNARDAMPQGGRVRIEVGHVGREELPSDLPTMSGDVSRGAVRLAVEDGGSGIPPEVLSRIFEPFFTTKGQGKGTGLGLATVLGATQQAGGSVRVESELDRGTRFEIYFPVVATDRLVSGEQPIAQAASPRSGAAALRESRPSRG